MPACESLSIKTTAEQFRGPSRRYENHLALRFGERGGSGCLLLTDVLRQEFPHQLSDLVAIRLQGEVPGIEQVEL